MLFVCEVIIKGTDRCEFTGAGGGGESIIGIAAVVMLGAVSAEICKIGLNILQSHTGNKIQIYIHNIDLIQREIL